MGIKIDQTEFTAAVERLLPLTGKRVEVFMHTQFKGIIREVVAISAPQKPARRGVVGKKRGEASMSGDLSGGARGLFEPMAIGLLRRNAKAHPMGQVLFTRKDGDVVTTRTHLYKPTASQAEMRAHHKKHWKRGNLKGRHGRRKVGKTILIERMVVSKGTFTAYKKESKKRVGRFAAGWNIAAAKMGVRPAAWIKRHNSPGTIRIKADLREITFVAVNRVPYGGKLKGMQRRVQWAVDLQTKKITNQIDTLLERAARDVGFL